ncbi:MAG: GNAT family N-acetyltransferase [Xanthomonadales bacterium]|nr:GNAT family N-acetyltransferase [Xanthomonadales bacterium]
MISAAPILDTPRLRLRQFRESDFEAYAELCADPEVMKYLGSEPWNRTDSWRHLAAMLGHWQLRGFGLYAVEVRETGQFAGRVGFIQPEGWPGFEVGWTLARPMWGNGYATEAARACLEHALGPMQQQRVISLIHPDNHASRKVAERIGETLSGHTELPGVDVPVQVYAASATAPSPSTQDDLPSCATIEQTMDALYRSISGPAGPRDWPAERYIFHPDARLMRTGMGADGRPWIKPMTVEGYIQDATVALAEVDFYEIEIARRIDRFGNVAQVRSVYEARHHPDDTNPERRGVNVVHLYHDGERWWIVNLLWDNERAGLSIPEPWLANPDR